MIAPPPAAKIIAEAERYPFFSGTALFRGRPFIVFTSANVRDMRLHPASRAEHVFWTLETAPRIDDGNRRVALEGYARGFERGKEMEFAFAKGLVPPSRFIDLTAATNYQLHIDKSFVQDLGPGETILANWHVHANEIPDGVPEHLRGTDLRILLGDKLAPGVKDAKGNITGRGDYHFLEDRPGNEPIYAAFFNGISGGSFISKLPHALGAVERLCFLPPRERAGAIIYQFIPAAREAGDAVAAPARKQLAAHHGQDGDSPPGGGMSAAMPRRRSTQRYRAPQIGG